MRAILNNESATKAGATWRCVGLGLDYILQVKFSLILFSLRGDFMHDHRETIRPRGYKTFFVLDSTEHEISTAHKN